MTTCFGYAGKSLVIIGLFLVRDLFRVTLYSLPDQGTVCRAKGSVGVCVHACVCVSVCACACAETIDN